MRFYRSCAAFLLYTIVNPERCISVFSIIGKPVEGLLKRISLIKPSFDKLRIDICLKKVPLQFNTYNDKL